MAVFVSRGQNTVKLYHHIPDDLLFHMIVQFMKLTV